RPSALERGSCSEGERQAAELIADERQGLGLEPVSEVESAHGTYWWPIGLACGAAAVAGLRGGALGVTLGAAGAAAAADDVTAGPRLLRRFLLPKRTTTNVSAELGDPAATRTAVFIAHSDTATGVAALLSLARWLVAEPPRDVRVILLFPGSEESFMEGMCAWGRRHFPRLPRESTTFICLDTLGSPNLVLLEGEGMLGVREYPKDLLRFLRSCVRDIGAYDVPDLRFRNATDGLI